MKSTRSWTTIGVLILATAAVLTACMQQPAAVPPTQPATEQPTQTLQPGPTSLPTHTVDPRVYFDDTAPDQIVLGNGYYELGLLKSNGGIAYITNELNGERISQGSVNGCLWSIEFPFEFSPGGFASCSPGQSFAYAWSETGQRLTLTYAADPAAEKKAAVTVTLTAAPDSWFDLQLSLTNDSGFFSGDIQFPAGLLLARDGIQEALLPVLPGVVLEQSFFQQSRSYQAHYPGAPGVFADFIALTTTSGTFAMYSANPQGSLVPAVFGINQAGCPDPASACLVHAFQPRVPDGQTWTSPRVRVLLSASPAAVIERFREDDGLDASDSLQAKLGDQFQRVLRSPLFKADTVQLGIKFSQYPALLDSLPQPGLLHVMAYSGGGFDQGYPDMLPPDAQWGTTAEMAQMFAGAQALDFLVMPYTNPTWWDEKSATLSSLPPSTSLADIAALNEYGGQITECYGCPTNPHYGIVVSPFSNFVLQRLEDLNRQMTVELPSDMVFEDQIGARPAIFDYNPASPAPDAYIQGWVQHAQTYQSSRLATEDGFDRLIPYEVGFHGSTLLSEHLGQTDGWWGEDNWHNYPFAGMLAGDKILFYQHNLAPETFAHNLTTLSWDTAMGYMLSYDLAAGDFGGGLNSEWIRAAADLQHFVLAKYAGERILAYTPLAENVTRTGYAHFSVITNWSTQDPYTSAGYILSARGMLIQKDDGSLTAGVFTSYNGQALENGGHCLIEERGTDQVIIRQPLGNDTPLAVKALDAWTGAAQLEARAYDQDDQLIASLPVSLADGMAVFTYQREINGTHAAYVTLTPTKP